MEPVSLHELTAAYALDALDGAELLEYEDHLGTCERCRADLVSLSEAAGSLAYAVDAPEPPVALRGRILDAARAERTNVVPIRRSWIAPVSAVTAVAAAAAAIGVGLWAHSLSGSLSQERSARSAQQEALRLVGDPTASRMALDGTPGALIVASGGRAAVIVASLPAPQAGKTYEAWVIEQGTPRMAALFTGGAGPVVVRLSRPVPRGAVVAATIEPAGGSEAPTSSSIFTARA